MVRFTIAVAAAGGIYSAIIAFYSPFWLFAVPRNFLWKAGSVRKMWQ